MKKKDVVRVPGWLAGVSDDSQEIIFSSSIRLLRNVKDIPMPHIASREQLIGIKKKFEPVWERLKNEEFFQEWNVERMSAVDRGILYEKHCMPYFEEQEPRAVFVLANASFDTRVLLNYQEHVNMQAFAIGLNLEQLMDKMLALESELESCAEFAFNKRYGYLTSKARDAGTALQASVVLHLPTLTGMDKMAKIEASLAKANLSLDRLYRDEQKLALGNLYVLSNRPHMHDSEQDILDKVKNVALNLAKREKQMRRVVYSKSPLVVENYVWRAVGLLKSARLLSAAEMLAMLSYVGLGIDLGIVDKISWTSVKKLIVQVRNSHLLASYPDAELDQVRASIVRDLFKEV